MNLLTAYPKVAGNKKAHPIDQMSLLCKFFISWYLTYLSPCL